MATVEGGPVWIRRPAQPVESLHDGCLMVMSLFEGSAVVSQGHRETHVQPGETVFYDATHPLRIGFTGSSSTRTPRPAGGSSAAGWSGADANWPAGGPPP
ncbi:hypothetical protein ACFW6E_13270 [Streptomyces olivaceoviridis]|uniref:hypothetical protein n=1 Tax=Streptomyces olivaceoviridis TaxID=1921 RepID=UPI0036A22E2A